MPKMSNSRGEQSINDDTNNSIIANNSSADNSSNSNTNPQISENSSNPSNDDNRLDDRHNNNISIFAIDPAVYTDIRRRQTEEQTGNENEQNIEEYDEQAEHEYENAHENEDPESSDDSSERDEHSEFLPYETGIILNDPSSGWDSGKPQICPREEFELETPTKDVHQGKRMTKSECEKTVVYKCFIFMESKSFHLGPKKTNHWEK